MSRASDPHTPVPDDPHEDPPALPSTPPPLSHVDPAATRSRHAGAPSAAIPAGDGTVPVWNQDPYRPEAPLVRWIFAVMPWTSLVISVVGAVQMDRSPERAPLVAGCAVLVWLVLLGTSLLHRVSLSSPTPREGPPATTDDVSSDSRSPAPGGPRALALGGARFVAIAANQWVLQLLVLFPLPLYWASFAWTLPQFLFMACLMATAAVTLWDPVSEALLQRRLLGCLLVAFGCFASAAAVLPMSGLGHGTSLWIAALLSSLALALVHGLRHGSMPGQRGALWRAQPASLLLAGLFPVFLLIGGARAIPPAPLRVVDSALTSGIQNRQPLDRPEHFAGNTRQLYCWTAIHAPLGLHEKLQHVWFKNDEEVARVSLDVKGGRKAGFRTWTRKRLPARGGEGVWSCEVRTPREQVLDHVSTTVGTRG